MKQRLSNFSRRYEAALRKYLKQGRHAVGPKVGRSGLNLIAGLSKLELAKLHEQILITKVLPGYAVSKRNALIRRAGEFFVVAISPIEKTKFIETLIRRTVELAASNLKLGHQILQGK